MLKAPRYSRRLESILQKFGNDIKEARIRRRITAKDLAERAWISPATMSKVEKGHPNVSLGVYARCLFALGLIDRLENMIDISTDKVGLTALNMELPKRVRHKKEKTNG